MSDDKTGRTSAMSEYDEMTLEQVQAKLRARCTGAEDDGAFAAWFMAKMRPFYANLSPDEAGRLVDSIRRQAKGGTGEE